jgi:hypothetical protein
MIYFVIYKQIKIMLMKKLMIMLTAALFIGATVQAQTNPGTSPVINGSGTYAPQMNPASGQANVIVGNNPSNNTGPANANGNVQNGTNTNVNTSTNTNSNTNAYRSTPTGTGVSSDSLSQTGANSNNTSIRSNPVSPAIGTQSGMTNQPTTTGTSGSATGTVATPQVAPSSTTVK